MLTVKQDTTLIGVSELRTRIDELLKKMRHSRVLIEKRNKPVAVIMSNEEYEKTESLLDMAEDIVMGYLAKERYENSSDKGFISMEAALKKVGR
ncbi:MAG: type II toxin-antitoxin system Phd/YefM family antitoxin [Elusimicrobia bacterium]|nr:type II toxin-antitoxin system Phd/YefM family antitoxin [Elusimicrobiota bacterium]